MAAMSFPALPELVKDGENGLVFKNSEQLAQVCSGFYLALLDPCLTCFTQFTVLQILVSWFQDFPGFPGSSRHRGFRENLAEFRQLGWKENWNKVFVSLQQNLLNIPLLQVALPIFKENPLRPKNLESLSSFLFALACVALILSLLPTTG